MPDGVDLVLGIGNVLWADEGFGGRCGEGLLEAWTLTDEVQAMDGGTQGLYLLPYVTAARRLLVFDAVDYGLAPGTLMQVEGDAVPSFMGAKKMSLHQTGFQEVLASARLLDRFPAEVVLIGVQPDEIDDYGGSLRPVVRACLPAAIGRGIARLRSWGHAVSPKVPATALDRVGTGDALALDRYEEGRHDAAAACRHGDARFLSGADPAGSGVGES